MNPQGFTAGFKDGSVGALNTANRIVLVLVCEECARVGKMWEFCLVWSLGLAPPWTLRSVCSFQLAFTLKTEIIPHGAGASLLPQLFLNSLVLFANWAREFITKQEQSEALRGSGCSGSDF